MMRWAAGAVLLVLLAGCGAQDPDPVGVPSARPRRDPVSSAVRDQAFPTDTLEDWVTYADRVVAVRVVAEDRQARLRTVTWEPQRVVWSNPARPDEDAPRTESVRGGDRDGAEPRLVVGHTYLAALTHTALAVGDDLPREWITLAVLPFDDDLVGDGESFRGWQGQETLLDAVWGKTGTQVADLLAATPVDPDTRPYAGEDATAKWQHAANDRYERMSPKPGPGPGER
jgi:hypothetical protein